MNQVFFLANLTTIMTLAKLSICLMLILTHATGLSYTQIIAQINPFIQFLL